ncbi:(2Fe-2S)-binding protein [Ketobacter sp.]|uniref:(2Fe-2S)-binding protein n=1 Tax=Ketobacter sp. TaxID=2083498 RepID=UPI000F21A391|nr:(2Fe-2S)-binding protein [Ketobacter sp.]RLU00332.1 MAG: (2Fe-2S)-binding protein [Ketobacter sp.]
MPELMINGTKATVELPDGIPLLWVLRDYLHLTGAKYGCGVGLCGSCTVHIDGEPVKSCIYPAANAIGRDITTIEGIGQSAMGQRVQQAWTEQNVHQCGYCQTGQIMSAVALLNANPNPSDADIDLAMSDNLCRCGVYNRIRKAIHSVADS